MLGVFTKEDRTKVNDNRSETKGTDKIQGLNGNEFRILDNDNETQDHHKVDQSDFMFLCHAFNSL